MTHEAKLKAIKTINRMSKNAYKWVYRVDMELTDMFAGLWDFIFPPKPVIQKPKPKIQSTAYPDGTRKTL